jgi:2-dehydro-3-deoxyphosphogluconate aldolase / (4S)-4-hydroxy-2-oxoglutarate aldolase
MFVTDWRSQWLSLLRQNRSIAVIRSSRWDLGAAMAKAVAAGGLKLIEIAWNSDAPTRTIERLRSDLPDCLIGVGTILNRQQLREAISAGAQYAFSPHFDPVLLATASFTYQIPLIPGALSPTEVLTAWQAGACCVKVFPIDSVGGANYLKNLRGPLAKIPLIPTGGVTLENAAQMLANGAIAVGLASELFPKALVAAEDWDSIAKRAQIFQSQCVGSS